MVKEITGHLVKDFRIEFRSRYAVNIALSFAVITTLAISLSIGGVPLSSKVQSILFWIIMFFSAMNGLSHVFTREEEQETSLFLRLNSKAETVFLSKLIFNIIVFFILQIIITPLYIFLLQMEVKSVLFFIVIAASGGISISTSVTILAAMVAKAGGRGSLLTVISFPVVLPLLWVSISATALSLDKSNAFDLNNLIFLLAFSGAMISVSYLLFEYVWVEE